MTRFPGVLVVRRRARRDILLLVGWTTLVSFAALLAVAAPRLLVETVDTGAQAAVASAGDSTDVFVSSIVGKPSAAVPAATPQGFLDIADSIRSRLPEGLRTTYSSSIVSVVGQSIAVTKVNTRRAQLSLQLDMLTPAQLPRMVLVSGTLPGAGATNDVVVSTAGAKAAGLTVGSILHLAPPTESGASSASNNALRVAAIVKPRDVFEPLWRELTGVWAPSTGTITVLAPPRVLTSTVGYFPGPFQGDIRVRLNPAAFTSDLEQKVSTEVTALTANDNSLDRDTGAPLGTQSGFVEALAAFPLEERASVAQMSLMIAGLLGAAAAVIVLLCSLLVERRSSELALERARGSSLVGFGARALLESALATVVAELVAVAIARLFLPNVLADPAPLILVAAIAVLAPVVQSILLARAVWRGTRAPANRVARLEILARARTRRFVIEGAIVVLAVAAIASLRTRGLLETRTDGVDPLLAAAPLLLAVVATLVVLRIYPFAAHRIARLGRRSRGPLGVLGAMQVERTVAILPLLALTLAVSLAVGGGLLIDTVRTGQVDASWQRIGADARVEAPVTAAEVARVAAASGVSAAATAQVTSDQSVGSGATSAIATIIAVDHGYARLVGQLPTDAAGGASTAAAIRRLATTPSGTAVVPIVVDRALSRQLPKGVLTLHDGPTAVHVRVVGVIDSGPSGYLKGPFVFMDLAALSSKLDKPAAADSLLVVGPGAERAAATLHAPKGAVLTRTSWVAERQHRALVSGVNRIMLLSAASVALLAILALIATVLATARARARSLALLRTLGMRSRLGWWLALAELAPVVLTALIGGTVAGVAMVQILGPALGLGLLSGGLSAPAPDWSPLVLAAVAGSAVVVLGLAMLAEVISHRRDRLSEVLRVGDS